MGTIREHLKTMHADRAAFHASIARAHKTAMDSYEEDSPEHTFHKAAANAHVASGEREAEMAQACEKADSADDLSKRDGGFPDGISTIAVPRYGSPAAVDVNAVHPDLRKFLAVD